LTGDHDGTIESLERHDVDLGLLIMRPDLADAPRPRRKNGGAEGPASGRPSLVFTSATRFLHPALSNLRNSSAQRRSFGGFK
jgi:hypothetical protein